MAAKEPKTVMINFGNCFVALHDIRCISTYEGGDDAGPLALIHTYGGAEVDGNTYETLATLEEAGALLEAGYEEAERPFSFISSHLDFLGFDPMVTEEELDEQTKPPVV